MPSSRIPWNAWQAQKYRNYAPVPSTLNRRVDIYKKLQTTNELGQETFTDTLVRTVWAQIVPLTGSMQWQQTETILTNATHRVTVMYKAAQDVAAGDHLMIDGRRLDIQFVLDPYESHWMIELFCQEVQDI